MAATEKQPGRTDYLLCVQVGVAPGLLPVAAQQNPEVLPSNSNTIRIRPVS